MTRLPKMTALALLVALTGGAYTGAAVAAPDYAKIEERKNAKTKLMGERTGKKVMAAFDLYNEDKVDEAIAAFKEMEPKSDFDKASVNKYIGQFLAQKEKFDEAIKYIRLAVGPDVLNFKDQADTIKLLADLEISEQNYLEAIRRYQQWMDFTGEEDPKVYAKMAQGYFELKQFKNVLAPVTKAIELSKEPNEQYYLMKLSAYFEQKQYKNAVKVAETLVKVFPENPKSWTRLGSFYMQTEEYKKGQSVMEVAYKNGYFETEQHFLVMAGYYSMNETPWKAAVVLEKAIKDGKVKREKKHISTLANYYHRAKHYAEAAKYYEEAAKFDNDGKLYQRAGGLLLVDQQYTKSIKMLEKALEHGSDKKGSIYSDMAEAYFYQDKFREAYKAILKAQDYKETRRFARSWAGYIKDKAARNGVSL